MEEKCETMNNCKKRVRGNWLIMALAQELLYATLSRELKKMLQDHKDLPGLGQLTYDLDELRRLVLDDIAEAYTPEQLVKLMGPEKFFQGLSSEQILSGLSPEFSPEQQAELQRILNQRKPG